MRYQWERKPQHSRYDFHGLVAAILAYCAGILTAVALSLLVH